MKKLTKRIALPLVLVFCITTTASAGPLGCGPCPPPPPRHHRCGGSSGWGIAVGILGGLILGSIISSSKSEAKKEPVVYRQDPGVMPQEPVIYRQDPRIYPRPVYVQQPVTENVQYNVQPLQHRTPGAESVELATQDSQQAEQGCYMINGKLYAPVK